MLPTPGKEFLTGLGLGVLFAIVVSCLNLPKTPTPVVLRMSSPYNAAVTNVSLSPAAADHTQMPSSCQPINASSYDAHYDDTTVADQLKNKVRILIWVMTYSDNLKDKTVYVKNTWGKRVDKIVYVGSENNTDFPTVGFDIPEGREHLLAKTMHAFRYLYQTHFTEADWFMKADDDCYVVVENLRYFLSDKNSSEPTFYGQIMKHWGGTYFLSGGAGYVLSKETLRRLATKGSDPEVCLQDGDMEDVNLARCMKKLGVRLEKTTDQEGRGTFYGMEPEKILIGDIPSWYRMVANTSHVFGQDSISHYPISFHYIEPRLMLTLDFMLYYARPYGIQFKHSDYGGKRCVRNREK